MHEKIKNILKIVILLSIFVAIIMLPEIISAFTVGDSMNVSLINGNEYPNCYSLIDNKSGTYSIYCIQHGVNIPDAPNTYHIVDTITIDGNTATYKGVESTSKSNGIMSYILSGGDVETYAKQFASAYDITTKGEKTLLTPTYTPRQYAIWYYWNTWIEKINSSYMWDKNPTTLSDSTAKQLVAEAKTYAESGTASIEIPEGYKKLVLNSNEIKDNMVGPFKVKFDGQVEITVNSVTSNNVGYKLYNSSGKEISQITSGEEFYIKTTDGSDIKEVELNANSEVIKTNIAIAENNGGKQRLIFVDSSTETQNVSVTVEVNITPVGNLTVKKQDEDTANELIGMQFKVKTSDGWLQQTSNGYVYNATFENATTYKISETSGKTISNLKTSVKYQIWETKTPNEDYVLEEQENHDSSLNAVNLTGNNWITVTRGATQTVTYSNKANYISISGYVWLDNINKIGEYNNTYEEDGEKTISGVTVKLMNKDGTEVARTTTDENGYYIFDKEDKKVIESKVKNFYIEFDYSGTTIQDYGGSDRNGKEYIPVAFNSENLNEIVGEGSRAIADEIPKEDKDLTGIASTYKGSDEETTYGLSGNLFTKLYNSSNNTLENINLGLKPIYEPQYEIKENLAYVKIVIGDYVYTYEYGAEEITDSNTVPTVKYQDATDITLYTRPFYPSAIYEAMNDSGRNIDVYVVYGIVINNTTTYSVEDVYQEQKLHITKLTNEYDTSRYELETSYTDTSNTKYEDLVKGDFGNWVEEGEKGTATYYVNGESGYEFDVTKGSYVTKYIQFKVKDDAVKDILNHPGEEITEDYPTTAKTTGYHIYTRNDYSWENNILKEQEHQSKSQNKESSAPYLVFELGKEDDGDRVVKGTVFEDRVETSNGEVLGNGKFDTDSEKTVSNVTVELLSATGNNYTDSNVATLYGTASEETAETKGAVYGTATGKQAVTTTDSNGTFKFVGVTPGEYYIRLTYGDGTQKIVNSDGTTTDVSINEYKSTIVTSQVAKNALGYETNNYGDEWYKYLEGTNYSVAIDNLDLRANYNDGDSSITNMIAGTAKLDITIENTVETYTKGEEQYPTFEGFNLGVITQPKQTTTVEKVITNVKLVNTPTIIFDGNPQTGKSGVSDLDGNDKNGGSTYTRVEIEEDEIYGSELTITYEIRVNNTSNINYYETDVKHYGWYYMFGEHDDSYSNEVQLKAEEIKDYLDSALQYSSCSDNVTVTISNEVNDKYPDTTTLVITGLEEIERNSYKSCKITTYKVLSTSDDDLGFTNTADVTELVNTVAEEDKENDYAKKSIKLIIQPKLPDPTEAYLTVTPPTGEDKQSPVLYVITGAVMLVILSVGVVIIKKKIL